MGRPTKLTPAVREAICKDLADGLTRTCAAVRAGITISTFKLWMRKGSGTGKAAAEFSAFSAAVKKAEQDAVARNVGTVQKAAAGRDEVTVRETRRTVEGVEVVDTVTTVRRVLEWQAAAWWLERKFPEDWSAKRHEIQELKRQLGEVLRRLEEQNVGGAGGDQAAAGGGGAAARRPRGRRP